MSAAVFAADICAAENASGAETGRAFAVCAPEGEAARDCGYALSVNDANIDIYKAQSEYFGG